MNIIKNFISEDDVNSFMRITNIALWPVIENSNWSERSFCLASHHYRLDILEKIQNTIREKTGKLLYTDTYNLAKWRVGDLQHPHADAEEPDGRPHPFPWREYGCMLYLNDSFEGGEIYFPNQGIELKPEPGMLAFFPGTLEYLHGVREVTEGTRYTLASFWTTNYDRRLKRYYDKGA